ncbi:GGDEF domain-containing protein [Phaeospirillum tilakii]|uniref:diguanylate cyclase n=1 Tax=Phaeospirillum tilakii TaxID=741673 RepID=A0ABW5C9H6_9PROT
MGQALPLLECDPFLVAALFADLRAVGARGRRDDRGCLLVLDIDHFHRLEETAGADSAEAALVRVAQTLARLLPPGSRAARLGSDKFAVLLAASGLGDALALAETLRLTLAAPGEVADDPAVPVSIGLADAIGLHDEPPGDTLERAGAALLRAKRDGRNRTRVAPPPRPRVGGISHAMAMR